MAYRGTQAKIPLGDFGLLTDAPADKLQPGYLIYAKNVSFSNGTVQKAPGTIKYNAAALSSKVVAIHDWFPNTVTQRLIAVTSDGTISKGRDRVFATMNTGLGTLSPNCVFAEGGQETASADRKLFLFTNGQTNPYVLTADGSAFAVISSPATDWAVGRYPKFGAVHRNRLWAFAGQFSYASNTASHENFTSGYLTNAIYPGEGGELRGAFVYKGRLFAFKDGGYVYFLNDEAIDSDDWYWQKLATNFGLAAPNAIAEVLDDMLAGNTTGTITSYAATQKLGNVEASDILQNAAMESFHRANTSKAGTTEQHLLFYSEKKQLFATYRTSYQTSNDCLLVMDVARENPRISYWIKGTPTCLAHRKDENEIARPMYGDASGYVHYMDREDRTEGGATAYSGDFQIGHTDFSYVDQKMTAAEKQFDWLAVTYTPESSGTLSCDYFVDGRFVETITFPMIQDTNSALDTLLLDTDRLAQANTETAVRRLRATGRTFSARFYNSGSNQSFQISSLTVGFRGGADQKAQKTT